MGTLFADPNGNVNTLWTINIYTNIDDGVRQPNAAGSDIIRAADTDDNESQQYGLVNVELPEGFKVINVKLWVNGLINDASQPYGQTSWGGGEKVFSLPTPPNPAWSSVNWNVDKSTQTDINNLQIGINSKNINEKGSVEIWACYVELTTEELPPEGPANIVKWNGIETANLAKWNGVNWSDLVKYNGVD